VAKQSSQKFIARNRAPRVQIEYDVEVYGAQKKIPASFVMGVMADLSQPGRAAGARGGPLKRSRFDRRQLDDRLKAMKPGSSSGSRTR